MDSEKKGKQLDIKMSLDMMGKMMLKHFMEHRTGEEL